MYASSMAPSFRRDWRAVAPSGADPPRVRG